MKAVDILTAIADNYEVGNGIGTFMTGKDYCEDLWRMFCGTKLVGEIEEDSKYLYFYEHYNGGILGIEYDAVVVNRDEDGGERIYIYKIA